MVNCPQFRALQKIYTCTASKIVRMVNKQPRITCKELVEDLRISGITITSQVVSNTFSQYGLQSCRGQKVLLLKKSYEVHLKFVKGNLYKPDAYWNNILWSEETKIIV